jgi:hypothetical protein
MKGGLGNQLFQYAAGRALALRQTNKNSNSVVLKLDISGYGENDGIDTMRHYSLSPFKIQADIATPDEINRMKYPYGIFSKAIRYIDKKVFRKFNIKYDRRIFNHEGGLYLDGFFQTEKYFIDKENDIRKDLNLIYSLSTKAREIDQLIRNTADSVSLHVRRGDYENDKKTNQRHGTCKVEYYARALAFIASKIGKNIHVFVFSDDIDWVRKNMAFTFTSTYVSSPAIPDHEELILMSKCHHNIIANSTFSWWGAWLNQNKKKIVVAPKQWSPKRLKNFKDITPSEWIRL